MTNTQITLTLTLTCIALIGCSTPDEAAEGTTLAVGFQVDYGARSSHLQIDRLDVWVAEVVFDADLPNKSISITEEQKARVDALTGTADPDLVNITLDPGTYESPYFGVEIWDSGSEPALTLEGRWCMAPRNRHPGRPGAR